MMKNLEEMTACITFRTRIFLNQVQVLVRHIPHRRTAALEEKWILEISLGGHHAINTRLLHTSLHVAETANVSVGKHWNLHVVTNFLNNSPISNARHRALHFPCSSVDCQDLSAGSFQHLRIFNCLFVVVKATNFACDGHLKVVVKRADYEEEEK